MRKQAIGAAEAAPAGAKERFSWSDAARGFCMILVALWHSSLWVRDAIGSGALTPWTEFGEWVMPLRMPLFFFVSGYFSISLLSKPLRQARRRTWGLMYLYVLWTGLFIARLFIGPAARGGLPAPSGTDVLLALLLPSSFWYLWCLPVYFVITWVAAQLLRERAVWLLIPLAIASAMAPLMRPGTSLILQEPLDAAKLPSALGNLVWFFAGACAKPLWDKWMQNARWSRAALGTVAFLGLTAVVLYVLPKSPVAWASIPLAVLGLYVSAQVLALVRMESVPFRALRWVGQRTLPMYIFHIFAISAIAGVSKLTGLAALLQPHSSLLVWVVPPVMVAVIVPLAGWVGDLISSSRVKFLLHAPGWLTSPAWPKSWRRQSA